MISKQLEISLTEKCFILWSLPYEPKTEVLYLWLSRDPDNQGGPDDPTLWIYNNRLILSDSEKIGNRFICGLFYDYLDWQSI